MSSNTEIVEENKNCLSFFPLCLARRGRERWMDPEVQILGYQHEGPDWYGECHLLRMRAGGTVVNRIRYTM